MYNQIKTFMKVQINVYIIIWYQQFSNDSLNSELKWKCLKVIAFIIVPF